MVESFCRNTNSTIQFSIMTAHCTKQIIFSPVRPLRLLLLWGFEPEPARLCRDFSRMLELFGAQVNAVQLSQPSFDVAGKFGYNDVCNPMVSISSTVGHQNLDVPDHLLKKKEFPKQLNSLAIFRSARMANLVQSILRPRMSGRQFICNWLCIFFL